MTPIFETVDRLPLMQINTNYWWELILEQYRPWLVWGGIALLALFIIRSVCKWATRITRRRPPPTIHPSLQKYNIDYTKQTKEQQKRAAAIVATSTGNRLAGYRIVRQVDAVFVEGYRTPQEAIVALKALAAECGANAILNVKTDRTSAGKCTASGDAIVAVQIRVKQVRPAKSPGRPGTD